MLEKDSHRGLSYGVDYLIIGGGIAGTTAAETIRQKDNTGSIAILSGEPLFLYSRVSLPKFIRGEIDLEKVMLRSAADYKKNGIEIFLSESVYSFDPKQMLLKTSSGREFLAKKILIASGGRPKQWEFETKAAKNIFRLQTLPDAQRIKKFLSEQKVGEALVVGGGFIALDFIKMLKHYGWKTTLLCQEKRFWPDFLDEKGFDILSETWTENNVAVIYGDEAINVESGRLDKEVKVITKNGRELSADFIGVAIGIERNLEFLSQFSSKHSNPEIAPGVVEVNEHLETAFPNVWAAGDVALYEEPFSGRKRLGGNWSGAFAQGRIAGLNMVLRNHASHFNTVFLYSLNHLGLKIAFVGDVGPFEKNFGAESRILHFNKEKKEYARILTKNNRVIGAALINTQGFMGSISQVILNKWDASKITLDLSR